MSDIPGYSILRPLGQGGMATVYLALQQSLGREVALKILSPALAQDATATQRFLREAHLAANLHHPNIVPIHDVGIHDGTPYMAMAYVPGGNVVPDAGGTSDPNAVLRCVRDIAGALDHAHRQGVIHRDIKPENILRQINRSCVLSDFGIARTIESTTALTQEGDTIGTPHYMSPEHLRGEKVDGRSDLYSLGVVFYQLLTGRLPYGGTDSWAIGTQHISAPIPRLPKTLERLQPLVDGLMAKEPATRLQTGAEVVRQIDGLLAGGTATPTMALPAAARAPKHRTPWLIGAAAALVVLGGIVLWRNWRPHAEVVAVPMAIAPAARSIAVLPLINESGDPQQDYFSDGLSEELISALTQVHDLKVIGRNSSFQFRGKQQNDNAAIGAKLGVATLLEGTVRKQADRVRIVVELVRISDGSSIWSQTYDRELKDVFAVQSEIATAVAGALKTTMLGKISESTDKPPSGNLEAYNAYLQGKYYATRRNRADYFKSVDAYKEAIRLDPDYALAYARLASAEMFYVTWLANGPAERDQFRTLARINARKAIELNPQLPESQDALGFVQEMADFDIQSAEATYRRAVSLAPTSAEALFHLASVTAMLGHVEDAIPIVRKALASEPLVGDYHFFLGWYLLTLGRLDAAESELRRAIDLQPMAEDFRQFLTMVYVKRGRADQAMTTALAEPKDAARRVALALVYAMRGDRIKADFVLNEMIRLDAEYSPSGIAEVYAYRGDADKAFAWLERAWTIRDPGVMIILFDPLIYPALHNDPRFAVFCRKVGLPFSGSP